MAAPTKHDIANLPPLGHIGKYEVLGRIAEGGMAEIFLAREVSVGGASRLVVVKRMLPHIARQDVISELFEREARVCMQLRHPNICPIYEYGVQGGTPYLAMEWIHGVALSEIIDRAPGTLPVAFVVKIVSDIAGALHAAHTATGPDGKPLRIVHRDVTPENIMIGFDGTVRLVDFGIATATIQRGRTETGIVKGKISYMAPEQFDGSMVDGRADVFSLGVSLYKALTGQSLFERENHAETMAAIVMGDPLPALPQVRSDVPAELGLIFARAVARSRADRLPTADDMQRELQEFATKAQHVVRAADLQRMLDTLFPGQREAPPVIERTGIDLGEGPGALSEVDRSAVEAELDEAADDIVATRKRKRRLLAFAAAALVLGVVGLVIAAAMSAP